MSELKACPKFDVGQIVIAKSTKKELPFRVLKIQWESGSWFYAWNSKNLLAESSIRALTAEEMGSARASSPDPASAQSIQRYSMETTKRGLRCVLYCKDDSGDYVKYSDHIQARPDPAREALVGALKLSHAALDEMCEWHGATHEPGCSEDDTCDCLHKPFNDRVNEACKAGERALAEQGHKGATKP